MWKVLYIAQTAERANELKALLAQNGFLCRTRAIGTTVAKRVGAYEILTPVSEAEDAYEVLAEHGFRG
ncbi:MAG: glutamate decarboxylase [Succiniclasticum sp.]|nr:glutamate decarboxylase [Succiniclasticum sp.]MCI6222291.1 glutamate decarboxylase [Selenomonadales bacterium]MDY2870558.1 hypothetical protein [Succiniclasticum sp.]MDY6303932.1 hypothetical protein [Succiniclasticum sp.]MDY6346078.1 hypothetical protein [Succiniclasticum sp.]